jgi:SPP1 gp7 family putative phage head morphogenesis protein
MSHMTIQTLLKLHGGASTRLLRRSRRIRIKPIRPSRADELWYKAELLKLVRHITEVTKSELLPLLKSETFFLGDAARKLDLLSGKFGKLDGVIKGGPSSAVAHKINLLSQRFGNIDATAKRLSRLAVQRNLAATDKQLIAHIQKAIGVNIQPILSSDGVRDELRAAEAANIDLIKSIPKQYFEKLRTKLDQNFQVGGRWESLAEDVDAVGDVTESRAKLIARDQTSKMNGAFNKARQTSIGISKYTWRTAGDERVRPTHRANDGKTFPWNSPPSETGNPGEDINCRCVGEPVFEWDDDE